MKKEGLTPYYRLSSFYFFHFASLAILLSFWPLYLSNNGYTASLIALLIASMSFVKIFMSNIWGWLADKYQNPMLMVRIALLGACVFMALSFFAEKTIWLSMMIILFSGFWHALPQFETTTMRHIYKTPNKYTLIRLWGSIGFLFALFFVGYFGGEIIVEYCPLIISCLLMILFCNGLLIPGTKKNHVSIVNQKNLMHTLQNPIVIALLGTSFLSQMSHASYYTFFSIYLKNFEYSTFQISVYWGIGVISEIMIFLVLGRLIKLFGLSNLILIALSLTMLRWFATALFVEFPVVLALTQVLHAASFAVYHGCAIQIIRIYFSGNLQGRGQSIYSSVSYGAGTLIGNLIAGPIWENFGMRTTYIVSCGVACVALLVATRISKFTIREGTRWEEETMHSIS